MMLINGRNCTRNFLMATKRINRSTIAAGSLTLHHPPTLPSDCVAQLRHETVPGASGASFASSVSCSAIDDRRFAAATEALSPTLTAARGIKVV